VGRSSLGSDRIVATHSVNDVRVLRSAIVTYNLLSGRWPRLKASGVVGIVAPIFVSADNECNICVTELCKLMGFFYYRDLPPA
jgi:hypothetical protein